MNLPDPLRTRDRRNVTKAAIDPATGEITGEVPMIGACRWRKDGRILVTPQMTFNGENAGPLDLILAPVTTGEGPARASLIEAMKDPNNSGGTCCD